MACALLISAVTSHAGVGAAVVRQAPALPATPAVEAGEPPDAFLRSCGTCHATDRVLHGRRFRQQWEELIEQMVARGAVVSDEDYEVILGYLVRDFGRVNVNTASAADVAEVLHLDPAEADAIIAARRAAGRFTDVDALMTAPGVPVEAVRRHRDALVF
jgi:mono/diheme cytochrome c family protein